MTFFQNQGTFFTFKKGHGKPSPSLSLVAAYHKLKLLANDQLTVIKNN